MAAEKCQAQISLTIRDLGRYWSRDGKTELDIVAEMEDGTFLFGECKWRADSGIRIGDYSVLRAKVAALPEARWRDNASYVLFAVGGFARELHTLASDPNERLYLVSGADLFA